MDEELRALVESLAARERRSHSELVREALRLYARSRAGENGRAEVKAQAHAAVDRAAGTWSRQHHPETLDPESYRRWRQELWAMDDKELEQRARQLPAGQ